MSEIKVNKEGLANQLSLLKTSGNDIDVSTSGVSSDGVDTLVTSMKYIQQHKQIAELLSLYKQLITKDADDIKEMQNAVSTMDRLIAGNIDNLALPF